MKFLLNMNLPRRLIHSLELSGHGARHVGDIGLASSSDETIVEEAERNHEVILTHDLDYGHILAFSGRSHPSVVIFRFRNSHPDYLLKKLYDKWPEIQKPLTEGAIVVLEDFALRIRTLPISGNSS